MVYRARDEELERTVAIKILPPGALFGDDARQRFRKEALALAKLSHPYIAAIYDVGQQDGANYIVMECVPGESLAAKLRSGPLAVKEATSITLRIAEALEEAHEHGVVHRDLKPGNVMITPKGQVKVLDFGLAKLVAPVATEATQSMTATRGILGAPLYMSPEQIEGKAIDARTDLWSLGVIYYESLTGRTPFHGDTSIYVLRAIVDKSPAPIRELRPDVPQGVQRIVSRALEKDAGSRYQSAAGLIADALAVLAHLSSTSGAPTKLSRWAPARLAATVMIALLLAAAAGVWFFQRSGYGAVTVTGVFPFTTYAGTESNPSFSPDGRHVAFSWDGEDSRRQIYIKTLGEERPVRLTQSTGEDTYPAWSPDGKTVAFVRLRGDSEGDIVLIPSIGGTERTLHKIEIPYRLAGAGRTLAWTPDSNWICFSSRVSPTSAFSLFLLSISSGRIRLLLETAPNTNDSSPAFSPDGRWLAFARFLGPFSSNLVFQRLSADLRAEGKPVYAANTTGNVSALVWLPDGKSVLFLAYDGSRIMQTRIGGAGRLIYAGASPFAGLTLSGASLKLVTARAEDDSDLGMMTLGGSNPSGSITRMRASSNAIDRSPAFSPDGRSLAFASDRSGASEIWLANSDGTHPRQLTHLKAYIAGFPSWSPDSRLVAFHARVPEEPQLYAVRVENGEIRQITSGPPGFPHPTFSADGRSLYMHQLRPAHDYVYRVSFPDGKPEALWPGDDPVEAPGRNLLLYLKEGERGIFARGLSGDAAKNPETRLIEDVAPPKGGFQPFSDGVYFVSYTAAGKPRAFCFRSFDSGRTTDIAPVPENYLSDLSVSPDRRRLAYTTLVRGNLDLVEIDLANR